MAEPRPPADRVTAAVRALAEPIANEAGASLEEVRLHGSGEARTLLVTVDHPDGVGIELITEVTRGLNAALDADEDLVPGSYTLEVSSPGVDKAIRTIAQLERSVGLDVRLQLTPERPTKLQAEMDGRLHAVDLADDAAPSPDGSDPIGSIPGTLTLNLKGRMKKLDLAIIDHAKVVLPW